jgi:hypothetical protein
MKYLALKDQEHLHCEIIFLSFGIKIRKEVNCITEVHQQFQSVTLVSLSNVSVSLCFSRDRKQEGGKQENFVTATVSACHSES